jgi:hypothetical protein
MKRLTILTLMGLIITLLFSCKKEEVPVVTTNSVTNITFSSATCGGNIIDVGSSRIIMQGILFGTNSLPTIGDNYITDNTGMNNFVINITELNDTTIYYVRAYAVNVSGVGYGNTFSFTTLKRNRR